MWQLWAFNNYFVTLPTENSTNVEESIKTDIYNFYGMDN